MEPSAEQLRIASLLEDKSSNTDLEQKIQKVIEFTGCSTDQAAVALYDTDYNIELACLKVLEAGDTGDTGADSWATVEKPQKKVEREDKPLVMEKFERSPNEQSNRGRGGGRGGNNFRERGRGDFRGRGGRGNARGSYGGDRGGDRGFDNSFNNRGGGGGRGRGGFRGGRGGDSGGRGGGRGRSEPHRGGRNVSRTRTREVRRGTSPTSESGSDAWGANEGRPTQWDKQNWESTEFKKSGWDEPDSMERFNNTKEKKPRKRSEGEQWDSAPRTQVKKPAQGKVERWQQQNDNNWNEDDSWDNKKNDGWKEARDWDEGEANRSSAWDEGASKTAEDKGHKVTQGNWSDKAKETAPPPQNPIQAMPDADTERKERLAKIFNKSVTISEQNDRLAEQNNAQSNAALSSAALKSRLGIQEQKQNNVPMAQNTNQVGPPGFSKPEQILSFGRSPEDAGRRLPPPVRSGIPKQCLQMPSEHEQDVPKAAQFLFGNFDETPPVQQQQPVQHQQPPPPQQQHEQPSQPPQDNYSTRMFPSSNVAPPVNVKTDNMSPPALKSLQSRFIPQNNLHSQSSQRKPTATQPNSEQNKDIQDHGLYNKDYITSREKAEKDLRNLLKQNPGSSSKPNSSSMTSNTGGGGGVVPGLTNLPISRHSPQQEQNGQNQSSVMGGSVINSAPGQGRNSIGQTRQTQYQPTISAVDSMGIHNNIQSYGNPIQTYDILQIQRPTMSRENDMRQPTNMNSYQQPYQPIQSFYNIPTIPYYPVIGQRQNSNFPQMTSYQTGQVGQATNSDSMRSGMRGAPQEIATPPPFTGISPHTGYTTQPGVFNQILIPQNGPGGIGQNMNMSHHQQDNRGPR